MSGGTARLGTYPAPLRAGCFRAIAAANRVRLVEFNMPRRANWLRERRSLISDIANGFAHGSQLHLVAGGLEQQRV